MPHRALEAKESQALIKPASKMRIPARWRVQSLALVGILALSFGGTAIASDITITQQPANQTTNIGGSFSLSVTAPGSGPLTYQWFMSGVPLYSGQSAQYYRNGAQPGDAGQYAVQVTDASGSATSTAATVTITPDSPPGPPYDFGGTIYEAQGNPVYVGGFSSNQQNYVAKWFKDGQVIPNATGSSLETAGQLTDAGTYIQVIGNGAGAFSMPPETVAVNPTAPANPWIA